MGLHRTFFLTTKNEADVEKLKLFHKKLFDFGLNEYAPYHNGFTNTDPFSWYEVEEDMKRFSKRKGLKDVILQLQVEEGGGDRWIGYFKNGKSQICESEIVYEEFDESKMK